MRNEEERKKAAEYTVPLILGLLKKNFINEDGSWTEIGRNYTERRHVGRFARFISTVVNNIGDFDTAYKYILAGRCIWLCDPEDDSWEWYGLNRPGTGFDDWINLIDHTADLLDVKLDIGYDLETFGEDDLLDI